ncbi:hypothetical protein COLO4_34004 [Corchorus olitorius]|uniref:Uncharacterized protein n=1 Tax=Corchorus olitorius TaxID=93759 RepID=A0A1R3GPC3_9ROSI|nr:hypothetical protein COLO4_34004 [Corchorus olitorius]
MDPADPHFPPMEQLPQQAQQLILILEHFLQMNYPDINDNIPAPILERPILGQITRLIIAYYFRTTIRSIDTQTVILEWIGLDHDDLPTTKRIVSQFQQPKILNALCDTGLANFRLPILNIDIQDPETPMVNLQQSEHNFTIQSTDKIAYIFTASNIIKAQIGLRTEFNLILETLSYGIGFHFGRSDNLSELSTALIPFNHPIDITILYYNVEGANLASFRRHLESLIVEYEPEILIMTETRMGNLKGHEMGAVIDYNQVVLPPMMENLPPLTRSIIMNFEDILQLAYHVGSLSTSCQIEQKPNFKLAIKAIIALPNNQIACDEQTISILKHWLQIRESEIPTQEETEVILQQPEILTQIFSRGLANHLPPSYTLLKPIVKRKFQKLTANFTCITVKGERCEITYLTTFPIFRAWITVSSTLDIESTTTQHNIHITLDPIGPTILKQASTSWEA